MRISLAPWTALGCPARTSCHGRSAQLFGHARPDHLMLMMLAPRGQHHAHQLFPLLSPAVHLLLMMHAYYGIACAVQ